MTKITLLAALCASTSIVSAADADPLAVPMADLQVAPPAAAHPVTPLRPQRQVVCPGAPARQKNARAVGGEEIQLLAAATRDARDAILNAGAGAPNGAMGQ